MPYGIRTSLSFCVQSQRPTSTPSLQPLESAFLSFFLSSFTSCFHPPQLSRGWGRRAWGCDCDCLRSSAGLAPGEREREMLAWLDSHHPPRRGAALWVLCVAPEGTKEGTNESSPEVAPRSSLLTPSLQVPGLGGLVYPEANEEEIFWIFFFL